MYLVILTPYNSFLFNLTPLVMRMFILLHKIHTALTSLLHSFTGNMKYYKICLFLHFLIIIVIHNQQYIIQHK